MPVGAAETIADEVGTSRYQIRRYIRLTNLIPELLQKVDDAESRTKGTYSRQSSVATTRVG